MIKQISLVGIGMDGETSISVLGLAAVQQAELLIGASRMLAPFRPLPAEKYETYHTEEILRTIEESDVVRIAVLFSGDVGFYSGASALIQALSREGFVRAEEARDNHSLFTADTPGSFTVCSGISTPVYLCGRLGLSYEGLSCVSLHGAEGNIARSAARSEKTFYLLGGQLTASALGERLCDYGLSHLTCHLGENLAKAHERIRTMTARELASCEADPLCALLTENPDFERGIRTGIPDHEFVRGAVPMTKAEVRAVSLSYLAIGRDEICWDLGCGTGAVSVELALSAYEGTVYAVDQNAEARSLTEQNAKRFACDNIRIVQEDVLAAADSLPTPQKVFIGGSGGKVAALLERIFARNPDATVVLNAVTLDTLTAVTACCAKEGYLLQTTQFAVTRTREVGTHTMLAAENPIFVMKIRAKGEAL